MGVLPTTTALINIMNEYHETNHIFLVLSQIAGFFLLYCVLSIAFLTTIVAYLKELRNFRNNENTALYNRINPENDSETTGLSQRTVPEQNNQKTMKSIKTRSVTV